MKNSQPEDYGNHPEADDAAEAGDILDDISEDGAAEDSPEDDAQRRYDELLDRLQRTLADFDNFRKRSIKEKAGMYDDGVRDTIEKLLPLLDNFERALAAGGDPEDPFRKGVEMLLRQLNKTLDDIGVTVIPAAGEPFDPNRHHAVAHVEDEALGVNIVAMELQKGYLFKDRVLRPSMVQVAN